MARRIFSLETPDRFLAGTVGEPGRRTFFLQARSGDQLVSVVLEKIQVAALADRLGLLIEELRERGLTIPATAREAAPEALEEPLEPVFRVETLSIAWDTRTEEVILEARAPLASEEELDEEAEEGEEEGSEDEEEFDDDDPNGPDLLRVRLTPSAVLAFVVRARDLVAAGRPPCPWCGDRKSTRLNSSH